MNDSSYSQCTVRRHLLVMVNRLYTWPVSCELRAVRATQVNLAYNYFNVCAGQTLTTKNERTYQGLWQRRWLQKTGNRWRRSLRPAVPPASLASHSHTSATWRTNSRRFCIITISNTDYYCHYGHLNTTVIDIHKYCSGIQCVVKCRIFSPNNETGNDCPQKSISQDGSHVAEKVSLKDKKI